MAGFPTIGSQIGAATNGANSLTAGPIGVNAWASVYVQIMIYSPSASVQSLSDNQSGKYSLIASGINGSVSLFVYRRQILQASGNFQITAVANSNVVPFELTMFEVFGDGGVDATGTVATGTGKSQSASVATQTADDLVLFFGSESTPPGTASYGAGQTNLSGYPTAPNNAESFGSYQTQTSAATVTPTQTTSNSVTWVAVAVAVSPQTPWYAVAGRPFVTVSPLGAVVTGVTNSGADFGPDTPGTSTSGIQEALTYISGGGTVFLTSGSYNLTSPISNTGNSQTVICASGVTLNFSNSSSSPYLNWNGDLGDIWVGCNFVTASGGTGQAAYHDCRWFGNGAVINCSGFNYIGSNQAVVGNSGEVVFNVQVYAQALGTLPEYNIEIDGFALSNFGGAALLLATNSFADDSGSPPLQTQWRNVRVARINAVMAQNNYHQAGKTFGTGVFFGECNGVVVEDCIIDCSNVPSTGTPDVSNCFVSCQRGGPTQNITFRRCRFNSGAGGASTNPGSCLEVQGANTGSGTGRGNTFDIRFEECVFVSGAGSGAPTGGAGGAYIDDTNGGGGNSRVYNLEFRHCIWPFTGMSFRSQGANSTPGYIRFVGAMPGALDTYSTTGPGGLFGRPIVQAPTLLASGQSTETEDFPLTSSSSTLASYTSPAVTTSRIRGVFRVSVYVASKSTGTPSISVAWTDPDTTAQSLTLLSSSVSTNHAATATATVYAAAGTAVTVSGSQSGSGANLLATAVIEQIA